MSEWQPIETNFLTESPTITWLFLSYLFAGCGFLLCLLGGLYFDSGRRRLIGIVVFVIGSLLGAAGILPWGFLWRHSPEPPE